MRTSTVQLVASLTLALFLTVAPRLVGENRPEAFAGAGGIGEGQPSCPAEFQCYTECPAGIPPAGSADTFVAGPGMVTARAFFASTALQFDNEIPLSISGQNCGTSGTNGVAGTGPLGVFRFGLVAGGVVDTAGTVTNTAELFGPLNYGSNPSSTQPTDLYQSTFVQTSPMIGQRAGHQATLLSFSFGQGSSAFSITAEALITGGISSVASRAHAVAALSSSEIFHFCASWPASTSTCPGTSVNMPAIGQFVAGAKMKQPRVFHQSTLLPNGEVLITGGLSSSGQVLASAELYNPGKGTFTLTKSMKKARYGHTATLLNDGTVLIAGGESKYTGTLGFSGSSAVNDAEIYNPATQTFKKVGPMKVARVAHTASRIPNSNNVLIAGGITPAGISNTAELYVPGSGFSIVGDMTTPRALHAAASIPGPTVGGPGEILVAGGVNSAGTVLQTAERFNPQTSNFVLTQGSMSTGRRALTAGSDVPIEFTDMVVFAGGDSGVGTPPLNTTDIYLPSLPSPTPSPTPP